MRLTKIYTKVGDKGQTLLASGAKVAKDSLRIESYGTIDELNSFIGLLRDTLAATNRDGFADITQMLGKIQNEMHDLGGELATPHEALNLDRQQVVTLADVERLEGEIDAFNEMLPPLANFILPSGHTATSTAHVCRTICRRAERRLVSLDRAEQIRQEPRIYLNRLSDWLFVVSRVISKRLGVAEVLWQQSGKTR